MLDTVYLEMLTLGWEEEQARDALRVSMGEADSAGAIEGCIMQPGNQDGCAVGRQDGPRPQMHMDPIMAHMQGLCRQRP